MRMEYVTRSDKSYLRVEGMKILFLNFLFNTKSNGHFVYLKNCARKIVRSLDVKTIISFKKGLQNYETDIIALFVYSRKVYAFSRKNCSNLI